MLQSYVHPNHQVAAIFQLSSGTLKDSHIIFSTEFKPILSQSRGIVETKNPNTPISSVGVWSQFQLSIPISLISTTVPESSRLEFLEKFSGNNFALLDGEDNTTGPLNRGGIADLPLMRTQLAIRQKSRQSNFCEVMDSFLSAYPSLTDSRTLLQRLLACRNFTLES